MNQWTINRLTGLVLLLLGGLSLLYPPANVLAFRLGMAALVVGCLILFPPLIKSAVEWIKKKYNAPYKPPRNR